MSRALDDEIDGLYQLGLEHFTAARNALARTAGKRAREVRSLGKPKAAAWAVNQLYWKHRTLFDRVVKTATDAQRGHVARLGGNPADIETLDARHAAALAEARAQATALLESAGAASAPTMAAVDRTLAALPSPAVNGRLIEPIESVGFGLLSGLLEGGSPLKGLADVVSLDRRRSDHAAVKSHESGRDAVRDRAARAAARTEAQARTRERQRLTRELNEAEAAESRASTALGDARKAVARADARVEKLEAALREARGAAAACREAVDHARAAANDAAAERVRRERALALLGE